jgi:hypothetical protein
VAALALILLLALALRVWGIRYGLPWLFYFHDEPQVVLRALRFGTGDLNPHFFIWPGTLLLYLAFAAFAGLFLVGRLAGWWTGKAGFAAAYFNDPSAFYLLARVQSVAFGVWTVGLAAALGTAAYAAPIGIAAALALAVNALAGHYAHLAHPVTAMTAFTVLGLWVAVRVAQGGPPRLLWLGSAAIALGTACQYHAALLVLPIGLAAVLRANDLPREERARWYGRAALALALGGLGFLALSPYVVLDFKAFQSDLSWITLKTEGRLAGIERGPWAALAAFERTCVRPALGVPMELAAALGAAVALVRRTRPDLVLLVFVAAYAALASRAGVLNDRYAIPILVPVLVLAARAVALLALGARVPPRLIPWAVPLAAALLCAPTLAQLVERDVTMTRGDTRVDALRWFEAHVPDGDRVVIDMLRFWNTASPPLSENAERLTERLHESESATGAGASGPSAAYAEYYRFRLEHPKHPAYYLTSTDMGTHVLPLADYRARGFRWAVVSSDALELRSARRAAGDSSGTAYYDALEREASVVARFEPERWRRLGPAITVYRLDVPSLVPEGRP